MKLLSYRGRRRLKRLGLVLGLTAVLLVLAVVVSFRYLERYMVYGTDGAEMVLPWEQEVNESTPSQALQEYPLSQVSSTTVEALAPSGEKVPMEQPAQVEVNPAENSAPSAAETRQGYYITLDDLTDPAAILNLLNTDPSCNTLILELKSTYGTTAYSSQVEGVSLSNELDVSAVDALLADLADRDLYLVALLPAYCDSLYALAHQPEGLAISGGALWMDWDSRYWLNPASRLVQSHLLALCEELASLGFDEVAFSDFTFPDSSNIVYDGNRSEALLQAAEQLIQEAPLPISFWDPDLNGPVLSLSSNGFFYIPASRGSVVGQVLSWLETAETDFTDRLIFCTDSHDTRFDDYPLLRPLLSP